MANRGADAWATLVTILCQNPGQAERLAAQHRLIEGRCVTCRSSGDGSDGRMLGCRLGGAARVALGAAINPATL